GFGPSGRLIELRSFHRVDTQQAARGNRQEREHGGGDPAEPAGARSKDRGGDRGNDEAGHQQDQPRADEPGRQIVAESDGSGGGQEQSGFHPKLLAGGDHASRGGQQRHDQL